MKGHKTIRFGIKLIVIFFSVVFYNQIVLHQFVMTTQKVVAAGLGVFPSWNDIANNTTRQCSIDNMNVDGRAIASFHGSSYFICSFILSTSVDHSISLEFLNIDYNNGFFYVERYDSAPECPYKYVAIYEEMKNCSNVVFFHQNLKVHIKGNTSLTFKEIPKTESNHQCPESLACEKDTSVQRVSPMNDCNSIEGYDNIEMCNFTRTTKLCSFYFPSNCNVTISKQDVILKCSDSDVSKTKKTLLLYPEQPLELDLSDNHILQIDVNSFSNLQNLLGLYLNVTSLATLKSGVFNGLHNLSFLLLRKSRIVSLDEDVFRGLINLTELDISHNPLTKLPAGLFRGLINLRKLLLEYDELTTINSTIFQGLRKLRILWLNNNKLLDSSLQSLPFDGLYNLEILRLDMNLFQEVHSDVFRNLRQMRGFALSRNDLNIVDVQLFKYFRKLHRLNMHHCQFEVIPSKFFDGLTNLGMLRINANLLSKLDARIFKSLGNVTYLDISENLFVNVPVPIHILSHLTIFSVSRNPMTEVNSNTFSSLKINTQLLVSQHEICKCYTPKDVVCIAEGDRSPYLTCDRLLSDRVLEGVMWLIGLNALAGNLFVLIWKRRHSEGNKVQSILLINLALSDLLMGVYMIIIASADIYFDDHFPMRSEKWRSGVTCRLAGTLSIVSSEASVFFVTLISIDRFLHIRFPYSVNQLTKKSTIVMVWLTWLVSLALGLVPSFLAGKSFKFYDNSHVCIGLPLAILEVFQRYDIDPVYWEGIPFTIGSSSRSQGFAVGLYYSSALFLGLNCICYLMIIFCYVIIVQSVRTTSRKSGRTLNMDEEIKLTTKVAAIVATDFFCWFPIIILGILVQFRVIVLPTSIYAWLVTCVLPINSAINPYLYTISEVILKYRK